MLNAERILTTLDGQLDHAVSLVLYGRAAIALGFANPPPETAASLDVDVIMRGSQMALIDEDTQFWQAHRATNEALRDPGLYMTHLFMEDQVFLRRSWEQHLVPIARPPMRWLQLSRPATVDLVLTKMMRGDDAQDMADVAFLIAHDRLTRADLEAAFAEAVLPDIPELHDAFVRARPHILALAPG